MRIIYHHRTRSTDAQRIHIQEMVRAFEELGHKVEIVSLVPTDAGQNDAQRDAGNAWWKTLLRHIPFAYELVQLAYNVVGIPMLLSKVLKGHVDFIYERYSLFNVSGVVASRLCGAPLLLEVNSPFALEQKRDREIRLRGFAQCMERTICNMATHVIVVSTPLARILGEIGVPAVRITVMPNGVNLKDFQPGRASDELRRSLGIADGTVVVGFIGWFRKWHGLEMLLDAFKMSEFGSQVVKVLLIGDGQAMPDLKEYVQKNGLTKSVIFTGPLPHAAVPSHLDLIDIAVQPAANEYCCPMKILEYMALGKPIVAPRQENIQELLREGEEAQLFTPGDAKSLSEALEALVMDRNRALRVGQQAREAIKTRGFLWTENARRVRRMVEGCVRERAGVDYFRIP